MKKMTSEQYRRKIAGAHAREAGLGFEEQIAAIPSASSLH